MLLIQLLDTGRPGGLNMIEGHAAWLWCLFYYRGFQQLYQDIFVARGSPLARKPRTPKSLPSAEKRWGSTQVSPGTFDESQTTLPKCVALRLQISFTRERNSEAFSSSEIKTSLRSGHLIATTKDVCFVPSLARPNRQKQIHAKEGSMSASKM